MKLVAVRANFFVPTQDPLCPFKNIVNLIPYTTPGSFTDLGYVDIGGDGTVTPNHIQSLFFLFVENLRKH